MSKFATLAFALSSLMALPAIAEDETGFYVSGFIGAGFAGDAELTGIQMPEVGAPGTPGAPANIQAEFDADNTIGVALGYKTPWEFLGVFHPRLELEYSTLTADVGGGSFNSGTQPFSGDVNVDFFLINNYSDIIWDEDQTLVPFVGGGLGLANVDANILYAGGGATAPNFAATGDDTGLAGTFAAGLTWLTGTQWEIYGEGRYYQIRDLEFERRFIGGGADLLNATVEDDFDGTALTIGARYKF
ncbi:MAG: outer membrane beta-barrel protein [Pseudomonadota bacterium]